MNFAFVKWYPGAFMAGTAHLSNEEVGAYIRLLCWQAQSGELPNDFDRLSRLADGMSVDTWKAIRDKFQVDEATDGLFNEEALEYISKQPIYLNNPSLTRPPGAVTMEEERQPRQAQALLKKNPKQRQWFYYGIDLVRGHAFENDNWVEHHPECQLHDKNGQPVERTVWDFGSECGTERWLNTSRAMIAGGLNGIFLDGFQGSEFSFDHRTHEADQVKRRFC